MIFKNQKYFTNGLENKNCLFFKYLISSNPIPKQMYKMSQLSYFDTEGKKTLIVRIFSDMFRFIVNNTS